MTEAVLLGMGRPARWLYENLRNKRPDIAIFSMAPANQWPSDQEGVVDLVDPTDLNSLFGALATYRKTKLAVFGKAYAGLTWSDLTQPTRMVIKGRAALKLFTNMPNTLHSEICQGLRNRQVDLVSILEFLPELRIETPQLGNHQLANAQELKEYGHKVLEEQKLGWRHHAVLLPEVGEPLHPPRGTRSFVDKKGGEGQVLVIREIPELLNIDVPVIDKRLVSLCIKRKIEGMIVDKNAVVVHREEIAEMADVAALPIHFV